MKDILVTMPRGVVLGVLRMPEDYYWFFRTGGKPRQHQAGGRVFFVYEGFVRGFGITHEIKRLGQQVSLESIGADGDRATATIKARAFKPGWYLKIYPDSWQWITPIPMQGFQGFRYSTLHEDQVEVVGGFRDEQPADVL